MIECFSWERSCESSNRSVLARSLYLTKFINILFTMDNTRETGQASGIEEKKKKINLNYDTISVLKNRLDENKARQRVSMTRAAYVKMIFDVTNKVDKQNEELNKTVLETRRLQKDISNLSGRLDRSFAQVEETILKVGKIRNVLYHNNFKLYRLIY